MLLPIAERLGRRALRLQGLESRMVSTAIADLHLYDARGRGDLPPVVILHGISSAATPFAPLMLGLRKHVRRVIAPEAPGHGFSGAPSERLTPDVLFGCMRELLDRELDEPAILFGNSLGGAVALSYALERPAKVRGLVLCSPAGAQMTEAELAGLLRALDLRSRADARAFLERLYHRPPWWVPLVAGDVKTLFERRVIGELTSSARPEHLFSPERLATLAMPSLLLWGRSEKLLPPSNLAFFRESLPPSTVIEEPVGWGHCPHLDRPADLGRRIVRFAREIPA